MAKSNTKKKTAKKHINPILGSGILANSSSRSKIGRLDCLGIITVFWAWAFPCVRRWQALITIFNLEKGKTPITVSIGKRNSRNLSSLLITDIETGGNISTITVPLVLSYGFSETGLYDLVVSFKNCRGKLKIPFEVREKKWPVITEAEKRFIKEQIDFFPKFQVNVHCSKCNHVYVFEESIEEIKSEKGGVCRFPENGDFECIECGNIIHLKDIQGQLRSALKDTILKRMRRK